MRKDDCWVELIVHGAVCVLMCEVFSFVDGIWYSYAVVYRGVDVQVFRHVDMNAYQMTVEIWKYMLNHVLPLIISLLLSSTYRLHSSFQQSGLSNPHFEAHVC